MVVLSSSRHAGSNSAAPVLTSLGIPLRTLERWRAWWRDEFKQTHLWLGSCGAFMPPLDTGQLPGNLLERFIGTDAAARMSALLRFLSPLSARARGAAA